MSSKKKVITIAVTTVALSLGSIGLASASNFKSTVKVKSSGMHFNGNTGIVGPNAELAAVLSALVAKGTLTQAQVDAINAAITAAHTARENAGLAAHTSHLNLIATTIGIDVATLQKRLAAGESLATIAGTKKDALITALVAEATKEIDAAVTAGRISSTQATTLKAGLTVKITTMVNSVGGKGGGVGHMGMGRGPGDRDHNMMGAPRFRN